MRLPKLPRTKALEQIATELELTRVALAKVRGPLSGIEETQKKILTEHKRMRRLYDLELKTEPAHPQQQEEEEEA